MVLGTGEYRRREHDGQPREPDNVPDHTRAVRASRDRLVAQLVHVDRAHRALVLLEHSLQRPVEVVHLPHADLALTSTAQQFPAVLGHGDGRHALIVTVVYGVQQPSGFRREYPDVAVVPRRDDLRAVVREQHAGAREVAHGDTEQLLERVHRPDAHVVLAGGGEHLAVAVRERQIVHHRRVTCEQTGDVEVARPDREQLAVDGAHQYDAVVHQLYASHGRIDVG